MNISQETGGRNVKIQFIRHATMILYLAGKKLLVDPLFSQKNTMPAVKNVPNKSDNPLVDLPVPIDALLECDAVFVTHMHRDHFDNTAADLLPKDLLIFCQPQDSEKFRELGFNNAIPVTKSFNWGNIKILRTKGKHGHGIIAKRMAPSSGFVISAPGEPVVYLTGDTVWCPCVEKVLIKYSPEVIISNCGEARFSLGKPITMDVGDILSLCRLSPAANVVAVHMDAWNHCRLSRKELRDFTIEHNIDNQVCIPENGELLEIR